MNTGVPQRKSTQRDVIYQELMKMTSHPTAIELYEVVRKVLPKVSLGTVYRNLDQLVSNGTIVKMSNGTSVRYDADMSKHIHIRCIICDTVADVHEISGDPIDTSYSELSGFKVISCNVEFFGICPSCLAKSMDKDLSD
ncbi:MAG TPA: transcriptional repressor [Bacteroidetes bacterium]|nr:transcriptional repressor [Bacteroidota bacterium]HEX04525.1 transcriptional repressor [Bacteroidota bacterium]